MAFSLFYIALLVSILLLILFTTFLQNVTPK